MKNHQYLLIVIAAILCYSCEPQNSTPQLPDGAVDMGLSVKWASANIGATNPEGYGDFYAWGETTSKSTYNWSTYMLCGGSATTMTKYSTNIKYGVVDNKTTLEPADDVAHVKLGEKWRMPTEAEWNELMNSDNCTWSWTTVNEVYGRLVTSKKTGNSIFLPAAGYRYNGDNDLVGYYGCYWSSSLNAGDSNNACGVNINKDYESGFSDYRYSGRSVRPVSE